MFQPRLWVVMIRRERGAAADGPHSAHEARLPTRRRIRRLRQRVSNQCLAFEISPAVRRQAAKAWKKLSNVPDFDKRENRFQTLFQLPTFAGSVRQVTLCTVE